MLFRLLGPVLLEQGAQRVAFTGKQGALLAALLLDAGRVVSVQRLAESVWDPPLPSAPASRVRMLVSEVRRACAAAGADVIETQRPGYVLRLAEGGLDLDGFQVRLGAARESAAAGRPDEALAHYEDALAWWHGTPLDGITGSFAEAQAVRLAGLRLDALEERLAVLLDLGRPADVATEAGALAAANPLRERLHELLMRALYASGRRTEALDVYRALRRRMVDELGLEPAHQLQRLHQRILQPEPPPAAPRPDRPPPAVPVPSQLPAAPPRFTNRDRELSELDRLLSADPGSVGMAVISGPGGVGKTWLALHWAHAHRDRYPDGQLFVNLHGFDSAGEPVPPGTVLRRFLQALGLPPAAVPGDADAQAALYRSLLADRRMLVVLDNARDAAQVTPLIPGGPGCSVLVTSRNALAGLHTTHAARLLEVAVFSDDEARRMLSRHLGPERLAADPASVAVLLEHAGGLPLALGVLAARAAAHPAFPLSVLADELRDPDTRLDALQTGDLGIDLRTVIAASYAALDAPAARLFLLLGVVPVAEAGLPAAAALAGLPAARARVLLAALEAANLVRQPSPGRYRMHDLIRLYAAERAAADLPADARDAALTRLVRHCAATAYAADRALYPHRYVIEVAGAADVPAFSEPAAMAWFESELPGLLAAQRLAAGLGLDTETWQLAYGLNTYLMRRAHLAERVASWDVALAAADRLGGDLVGAIVRWHAGSVCGVAGRLDEGVAHLERALQLFRAADDPAGLAHTHHMLAWLLTVRGEPAQGLAHGQAALAHHRAAGEPIWEANSLSGLGWIHMQLGDDEQARACCEQALTLFRRHDDSSGESATLDSLGRLASRRGDHESAVGHYARCLALRESNGNTWQAADTLVALGDSHHALGDADAAETAWRAALALYEPHHRHADVARVRARLGL
ncbi:tetratricopeptide repeat protein [Actinomadura sp. ATCC 31491]|uniref:Tetratricopeptide repeat protein n=1 Tax=Actinomadura luzonensis TaxID=2805427 RepID=A0ABT0FU04_9ACTN|nr:BTAD domain-containing putative transcriptional regulator [Actinomadura luzonensis]MCK2215383.1 tetratricopeptide repeat protein [Actinomadura luzonensis]